MLKKILAFSLISFCHSVPGISNEWYQASLFERSPVTSFFLEQQRDVNTNDIDFLQYVADRWPVYHESWIINKFWVFNEAGHHIDNCTDLDLKKWYYNGLLINADVKQELRTLWPSEKPNGVDEELWALEFNTTGSCVSSMDLYYFNIALQLLDFRNVGIILSNHDIHPDRHYKYDHIVESISDTLKKRFHIKCLTPKNSGKQYLLEVEICYNPDYEVVDCLEREETSNIDICDPNKDVFYPGLPRN